MGLIHQLPYGDLVPLLAREIREVQEEEFGRTMVEIGLFNTGKVFVFRCPTCGKEEVNDQRMELACTGPNWTDSHPIEPMRFVGERPKESRAFIQRRDK